MQASLAKLVEELKISCLNENDLKQEFFPLWNWIQENWGSEAQIEYLNLLTKKQYLPYSYLTSEEVLSQSSLPSFEEWNKGYDLGTKTTQSEYDYALNAFEKLKCKTLFDYVKIYQISDILLLSSVFESWRKLGRENFGLDCANFVSLPSFGFSAWLHSSGIEIDLLQSYDHILLFEKAKRGGWSGSCGLRYACANIPEMKELYDPTIPKRRLLDMDFCSLYGYTMTFHFPWRNFRDCSPETLAKLAKYMQETKGVDIKTNSQYSFVVICDLKIKEEYCDLLENFPPLVYNTEIPIHLLSPKMKQLVKEQNIRQNGDRLIADLRIKKNYVITAYALKCFLRVGVVCTILT